MSQLNYAVIVPPLSEGDEAARDLGGPIPAPSQLAAIA